MSSQAWKQLEAHVCRALGSRRRHSIDAEGGWAQGSDDDGTCCFAVEVKRTTRPQLREAWLVQARRNAMRDGRPWLLVQRERHGSPKLLATLDFYELVALLHEAGRIERREDAVGEEQQQPEQPDTSGSGIPEQYEEGGPTHTESAEERREREETESPASGDDEQNERVEKA